jgi:hypothetical protein
LEQAVLAKLLAGDHPVLAALREQAKSAQITSREFTGTGFYCSFQVPSRLSPEIPQQDFEIGDVNAESAGVEKKRVGGHQTSQFL